MVKTAGASDQSAVVHTIVLAFAADPIVRWFWPEPHQYLSNMPGFTLAMSGGAFGHQSAHFTEGYGGAALWLPPDVHPDEEKMGEIAERTVPASVRGDLFAMMEQMAGCHPTEPHWYLPMIGVDPVQQGRGLGAALLAHALERCDREGLPAYLESTNPRNITLYQRHGFNAIGEIQVGTSPRMVPMVRQPRS
jgi:GNAT superfamily N-acetyltransferase